MSKSSTLRSIIHGKPHAS